MESANRPRPSPCAASARPSHRDRHFRASTNASSGATRARRREEATGKTARASSGRYHRLGFAAHRGAGEQIPKRNRMIPRDVMITAPTRRTLRARRMYWRRPTGITNPVQRPCTTLGDRTTRRRREHHRDPEDPEHTFSRSFLPVTSAPSSSGLWLRDGSIHSPSCILVCAAARCCAGSETSTPGSRQCSNGQTSSRSAITHAHAVFDVEASGCHYAARLCRLRDGVFSSSLLPLD